MIRTARMEDVKDIHTLINSFAGDGLLLNRSISSLYDKLRDFHVFTDDDNTLLGVCALQITWDNLAEVRSLAVKKEAQGKGIGAQLVRSCLAEAEKFGIQRIFTLTYQPGFFEKLGFKHIDKKELPHKIWSDCIHCHKFPDCDEDALMYEKRKEI
jgi:amino-acid N-acetyltransferase